MSLSPPYSSSTSNSTFRYVLRCFCIASWAKMPSTCSPARTDRMSCISHGVHEAQGAVPLADGRPLQATLLKTLHQKDALTSCTRHPGPLLPVAPAPDQYHLRGKIVIQMRKTRTHTMMNSPRQKIVKHYGVAVNKVTLPHAFPIHTDASIRICLPAPST